MHYAFLDMGDYMVKLIVKFECLKNPKKLSHKRELYVHDSTFQKAFQNTFKKNIFVKTIY